MKPINKNNESCTPTSSNCISWQGPSIDFLELCNNASLTEVVYEIAMKMSDIIDVLDVDNYDITCLETGKCGPEEFSDIVNTLTSKLCELYKRDQPVEFDITTATVKLDKDSCFVAEYGQKKDGEYVTEIPVTYLSKMIANSVCLLNKNVEYTQADISNIEKELKEVSSKFNKLQNEKLDKKEVDRNCITQSGDVYDAVNSISELLCKYTQTLSSPEALENSFTSQCSDLDIKTLFGSPTEKLSDVPGFTINPKSLSDVIKNIWIVTCDMRNAIENLTKYAKDILVGVCSKYSCDGFITVTINFDKKDFIVYNDSVITITQGNISQEEVVTSEEMNNSNGKIVKQISLNGAMKYTSGITTMFTAKYVDNSSGIDKNGEASCSSVAKPVLSGMFISETQTGFEINFSVNEPSNIVIFKNGKKIVEGDYGIDDYTVPDNQIKPGTKYTYAIGTSDDSLCFSETVVSKNVECPFITFTDLQWNNTSNANNVTSDVQAQWNQEFKQKNY